MEREDKDQHLKFMPLLSPENLHWSKVAIYGEHHLKVEFMTLLSPDLVAWRGRHLQLRVQALSRDTAGPLLCKKI